MPDASVQPTPPSSPHRQASQLPQHLEQLPISEGEAEDAVETTCRPLLTLPLEVVSRILEHTFEHPDVSADNATSKDPRNHGWRPVASLDSFKGWQATYADQILSLMRTCKIFHAYLRPRLYAAPVILTPAAVKHFSSTIIESSKTDPASGLHRFVTTLTLYPLHNTPPRPLTDAWRAGLLALLPHLPFLHTFVPGVYTSLLRMELISDLFSPLNQLRNLDHLDLYYAYLQDTPSSSQDGALSLLTRAAPHLDRVSFTAINLLEKGCGLKQDSSFLLYSNATLNAPGQAQGDEVADADEWSPEDSCAERFVNALKLAKVGLEWEEEEEDGKGRARTGREKGIESLMFWADAVIGVGVLHDMLELLPNLRCFHLDAFSYLAPSLRRDIAYYQPRKRRLSLPKLVHAFAGTANALTELTFAPMFAGQIKTLGNMDELLLHLPHLTHLELRADFVTPRFFLPLLPPAPATITSLPLRYLAFHILPPHAPPSFVSTSTAPVAADPTAADPTAAATTPTPGGTATTIPAPSPTVSTVERQVAITICQFFGASELSNLAQAVQDVFLPLDGGPGACSWPVESQEENEGGGGAAAGAQDWVEPVWYDVLIRLGTIARGMGVDEEGEGEEGLEEEE